MTLPTEIFGDVIVVHSPEELAYDQAEGFGAFMATLERVNVVLDLDATETLDSKGLAALLDAQEYLRELGGDMKLSATNPSNRKILEMTRLDACLEVFESVVDAVRSYQQHG